MTLLFATLRQPTARPAASTTALAPATRGLMVSAGCVLAGMLAIGAWLTPDPSGRGTHQQLGLPPCTFSLMVGRPCPSCGMTTSWTYLMHAQPWAALQANIGGVLLALPALLAVPWLLLSAALGRDLTRRPGEMIWLLGTLAIASITLGQWTWRMMR